MEFYRIAQDYVGREAWAHSRRWLHRCVVDWMMWDQRCRGIFGIELGTAGHPLAHSQGFYLPPSHLHSQEWGREIHLERYQSQFGHW